MDKSYVAIMSEVVNLCSKKWSDQKECCLCECDSNWYTNMYLDYSNNYVAEETFITSEIMNRFELEGREFKAYENLKYESAARSLIHLFQSVGYVQPMLSHERIGEICIKILKGEF